MRRRQRTRPATWEPLSAKDVDDILEEARIDVSQSVKGELRQHINNWLSRVGELRSLRHKSVPSKKLSEYKKIHDAAAKLLAALRGCDDAKLTLAYEWDKLAKSPASTKPASIGELRTAFPGSREEEILFGRWAGVIVPSSEAEQGVREVLASVAVLKDLARNAELTELSEQSRLRSRESPRKPDDLRKAFILIFAMIFRYFLKLEPKTTEGGPWVVFLAAVLSRCERKRMTAETAKSCG